MRVSIGTSYLDPNGWVILHAEGAGISCFFLASEKSEQKSTDNMIIQAFLIGLQRYEKAGNYKRCVFVYFAGV